MTSLELREKRTQLVESARKLIDQSKAESRDLTDDEAKNYDEMIAEVDKLSASISRTEKLEAAERSLETPGQRVSEPITNKTVEDREARHVKAYKEWLRTGEQRDTVLKTDSKGGYLVAPVQIADQVIKTVDKDVFVRRFATMHRLNAAKKIGIPKMTNRMSAASWGQEITAATEDTTMSFARVEIEPVLLAKLAKASILTLEQDDSADSLLRGEISYAFSEAQEQTFMTGSGTYEPLGLFTPSTAGIPTSRDVSITSGVSMVFSADKLIDAKGALRPGYRNRPSCGWVFNPAIITRIRKLKDDSGAYVWQPSLVQGDPDRLLGLPVYESEFAPSTVSSGAYVGILGDLAEYHIVEVPTLAIQRLDEKYAETHEVGFIARTFVNGNPGNEEAFVRLKIDPNA